MTQSSHAAVRASEEPTPQQLQELFRQIGSGRVTKDRLQVFLRKQQEQQPVIYISADYDQSLFNYARDEDLSPLVHRTIKFWEQEFPGTGRVIASQLEELLRDDLVFQLGSREEVPAGKDLQALLQSGLFRERGLGVREIRVMNTQEFSDPFPLHAYDGRLYRWLERSYDDLSHVFHFEGSLPTAMRTTFQEKYLDQIFGRDCSLERKFWKGFKSNVGEEYLARLDTQMIGDHLRACVFTAAFGGFLTDPDHLDTQELLWLWINGTFPIGLDDENRLVLLCA